MKIITSEYFVTHFEVILKILEQFNQPIIVTESQNPTLVALPYTQEFLELLQYYKN